MDIEGYPSYWHEAFDGDAGCVLAMYPARLLNKEGIMLNMVRKLSEATNPALSYWYTARSTNSPEKAITAPLVSTPATPMNSITGIHIPMPSARVATGRLIIIVNRNKTPNKVKSPTTSVFYINVPVHSRPLLSIDANLKDVVKEGKQRRKRERRDKQRHESKLKNGVTEECQLIGRINVQTLQSNPGVLSNLNDHFEVLVEHAKRWNLRELFKLPDSTISPSLVVI